MADELPPDWEAVTDEGGRTYWWNVSTNETTWTKPQVTVATKGVAVGYLSSVKADDSTTSKAQKGKGAGDPALEAIRSQSSVKSSVSDLTARFSKGCSTSSVDSAAPSAAPPQLVDVKKSSATSVTALKKLQEAKEFLAKSEEERKSASSPHPAAAQPVVAKRGTPERPPKVDLFK